MPCGWNLRCVSQLDIAFDLPTCPWLCGLVWWILWRPAVMQAPVVLCPGLCAGLTLTCMCRRGMCSAWPGRVCGALLPCGAKRSCMHCRQHAASVCQQRVFCVHGASATLRAVTAATHPHCFGRTWFFFQQPCMHGVRLQLQLVALCTLCVGGSFNVGSRDARLTGCF